MSMLPKSLRPLFPYIKKYRTGLVLGAICVLFNNGIWILLPQVIRAAVNALNSGVTVDKLKLYASLILLVACAKGIFQFLTRWIVIGISRDIEFDLRNDFFQHLESLSHSYYQRTRTGDIMARTTNDLSAVRQLLGPAIMYSANTLVFTCAALPFMWRISPKLTFFAFVPMPAASVLVQYFGNRIHRRFERIQAMFSDISAKAQENFSGARLIRAFAQEEAEIASFEEANREYIRRSLHLVRLMAMLWPSLELVLGLSLMITLLVGGHEVVQHKITVGEFTSFNVYMVQLIWPIIAVGWVVNLFQRGTASVVRIDELLKQQPSIADDPALVACKPDRSAPYVDATSTKLSPCTITGDIEFRNLSFAYPNGPTILHDINLTIPAGSSLAIVGPTGSGKSTLVSLIPRLQDATPGTVLIDSEPIRSFPLSELRSSIGFVPQETFLFSDTIRHNVSFGAPDATDQQVEDAAAIAHIRTEILEFPRGFDTMVGERGVTLSGGQKQRTAIARAVIRDPRVLILDDALASVDTYTEERILQGLARVMQGRTTIFISHRISTARNADQIAVLVAGRIAELGTHDELIARNGYYTSLFEKQRLEEELAVTT